MLLTLLITASVIATPKFYATSYQVILGGDSIGLQLDSDIKITGKYYVDTDDGKKTPWEKSNIAIGDSIIKVDGVEVYSLNDITRIIANKEDNSELEMTVLRNGRKINTKITLYQSKNNKMSLGLYIKDKILGIGTLTFIDANKKQYAALGHGVVEASHNKNQDIGVLTYSTVSGIKKATTSNVGEKRASLINNEIGKITANTNIGIFGSFTDDLSNTKKINIAEIAEIYSGKAQIVTVISGTKKEYFDIEITDVVNQKRCDIKGLKIKVTDKELLSKTGGIIQGMSGSPIIQNGKLVGAVSHVTVEDPTIGYGIFAKWMYESMN